MLLLADFASKSPITPIFVSFHSFNIHPSTYLPIHPPIFPSIHLSSHPSTYLPIHPPISPSIHLSFHPSTYLPIHPSISPSIHLSPHPSTYLPIHPPISPSIHLSPYPSTYLPIYPSIYSSIHLSPHLSIHLFIYPFLYLSTHLFTHPSVHPSITLSTYFSNFFYTVTHPVTQQPPFLHPSIRPFNNLAGTKRPQYKHVAAVVITSMAVANVVECPCLQGVMLSVVSAFGGPFVAVINCRFCLVTRQSTAHRNRPGRLKVYIFTLNTNTKPSYYPGAAPSSSASRCGQSSLTLQMTLLPSFY